MLKEIVAILQSCLQLDVNECNQWNEETLLLGAIAEFDSMAVVSVLTMVEENYGLIVDDDDISAEVFETVGSLTSFVQARC